MDVLDEKQNGAPPPMEVDEVVSVRDRKSLRFFVELEADITASQDEAFASKHMPDLGHDVKDFTVYTWRLNNWKKLEKKLTSPEFDCGGHKWSRPFSLFHSILLIFSRIFKPLLSGEFSFFPLETRMRLQMILSLYISIMPTRKRLRKDGTHVHSSHWLSQTYMIQLSTQSAVRLSPECPTAAFKLLILYLDANHRFIAEECDWGFTRFSELRKIFNVQEGHLRPTIEDESAEITVYVRVLEDPTGVLWHNFVK